MSFYDGLDEDIKSIAKQQQGSPLYSLLDGWHTALDLRWNDAEQAVIASLCQQVYPTGEWRFPMQSVVVPEQPTEETIVSAFTGARHPFTLRSHGDREWIPGGQGHLLPLKGEFTSPEWTKEERLSLLWNLQPTTSNYALLNSPSALSLLAFASAAEPLMEALLAGSWAVQSPDPLFSKQEQLFTRVEVARYEGYLEFERAMAKQRPYQRHLDHFLPGFYPYARKFLEFRVPGMTTDLERHQTVNERQHLGWTNPGASTRFSFVSSPKTSRPVLEALHKQARKLLYFNAVPIYQMQMESPNIAAQQNNQVKKLYAHPFFATASDSKEVQPCSLLLSDTQRDIENEPLDATVWAQIDYPERCSQLSIFFNCYGAEAFVKTDAILNQDSRRQAPFRVVADAVGGATLYAKNTDAEGKPACDWEQTALYSLLFRPVMQTPADVAQLLRTLLPCRTYLDSNAVEISFEERVAGAPHTTRWSNYLWPVLYSETDNVTVSALSAYALPHAYLLPTLCLHLHPKPAANLSPFLTAELENYTHSVLTRFIGGLSFLEMTIEGSNA